MTPEPTLPRILARALLVLAIPLGTGCGRPVPQVARENIRYAQALRTAANSRDAAGFENVARTIERDAQAGRIAADEQAVYAEIVALGRAERFADAEQRCLAFLREQARR
jgi:hypothetical protein